MNCSRCRAPGMCVCELPTTGRPQRAVRLQNYLQQQLAAEIIGPPLHEGGWEVEATGEQAEEYRTKSYTVEVVNDQTGARRLFTGVRPVEIRPGVFKFSFSSR